MSGQAAYDVLSCGACWHLRALHGKDTCRAKVFPAHSLDGEPCPCDGYQPQPQPAPELAAEALSEHVSIRFPAGLPEPLRISVRAQPAPQGSKTVRQAPNGRVNLVESSKGVKPFREAVRAETQRAAPVVLTGPVEVILVFLMARPKSHYRTGRNAHLLKEDAPLYPVATGRNDIDKLSRAVLDGLTAGGAWLDDAQVAHLDTWKRYGQPGVEITVRDIGRASAHANAQSNQTESNI